MERCRDVNIDAIRDLDRPDLVTLWSTLRERLERRPGSLERRPIKLVELTDDEVVALCGLLGRRRPSKNEINIDLVQLDEVLRSGRAQAGLVAVLEALGGPLRDREAERMGAVDDRALLWGSMLSHRVADDPRVRRWIDSLLRRGRLTRLDLAGPDDRIESVMDAVESLLDRLDERRSGELGGNVPIAVLAAEWFGDAHALDVGGSAAGDRVLATLVADAVLQLSGEHDDAGSDAAASPDESPTLRAAWAEFGVEIDAVNSSVLVLNLPGDATSVLGSASAVGEPMRMTNRALRSIDDTALAGRVVWVCENPSIVALAADRLGVDCAPMVCTDGMPKTVTSTLLGRLASVGCDIRVHADFDVGGVAIARFVIARWNASPWRFGRAAYLAALADRRTLPLSGLVAATPWDDRLADAMNEHRLAVHEEAVAATLLTDLATI